MITEHDFPEGTTLIEIREIYDGWSVAKLPDGTLVNSLDKGNRRYVATEQWIKKVNHE